MNISQYKKDGKSQVTTKKQHSRELPKTII